jgi:hypothetical protein
MQYGKNINCPVFTDFIYSLKDAFPEGLANNYFS